MGVLLSADGDVRETCIYGDHTGRARIYFEDGDLLQGEVNRDGDIILGVLMEPSGYKYIGEFDQITAHGFGICTYPDNHQYIGHYINGKRQGLGMYLFPDGDSYVGEFKSGKSHGFGCYLTACGHYYYEG